MSAVSTALAQNIVELARSTERFHFALSGGNTPRTLYALLATDFRNEIPWESIHLFWGDERYVPQDNAMSNYHLIREALLEHVKINPSHIHPIPTNFDDPDEAAKAYEAVLKSCFSTSWPTFNLVLLGLGHDGHTASLFPGSPALENRNRWVIPTKSPTEPHRRITLTLSALAHAKQIYFLVTGADKTDALQRTLTEGEDTPAARLLSRRPDAVFWTDEAAARRVRDE